MAGVGASPAAKASAESRPRLDEFIADEAVGPSAGGDQFAAAEPGKTRKGDKPERSDRGPKDKGPKKDKRSDKGEAAEDPDRGPPPPLPKPVATFTL